MSDPLDRLAGRARSGDPLGSIGWTERTGGVLTARECITLARPLLRVDEYSSHAHHGHDPIAA